MAVPNIAGDIADYLLNTTGLSDVYVGTLPDTPIAAYAVVEYGGPANVKTHGSIPRLDNATVQIQARATKTATALTNILAVAAALDGLMDTTINSTVYLLISEISRPRILIHEDERGATMAVWECSIQARR